MDQIFKFFKKFDFLAKNTDIMMAVGLIMILIVMIIPLPSTLLDLGLTFSLTMSLLILIVAIYTRRTLDFSVFPTLLLMSTLFRLSLNVASTRLILSDGHSGASAAGNVIESFSSFVVGNNYAIGFIVFVILVVINFVVITKGSGRVAEVAARFTLDAMPGKQMSIDADLNAGLITENQARERRREIEQEADFYGAMDGASKFVRGDAIAGIIITIINIVGGLFVGAFQRDLSMATAAEYYTKLTIGDGLVTQIPALIISVAAGTVVTRSSSGKNMGREVTQQLFMNPRALYIVSFVLCLLSLISGMPTAPFMAMGLIGFIIGFMVQKYKEEQVEEKRKYDEKLAAEPEKEKVENLLPLDLLELEVGYGLINVVESDKSGDLVERIVSIRKQFAMDLGIVVPSIHIRDNLQLDQGEYQLLIKGNKVASGKLMPDYMLAMDPGNVVKQIKGISTKEPAFGLDATWITPNQKEEAEIAGYTVVDLSTVIATHLTELVRQNAHELLGRQEASQLIDNFKKSHPKVVEDLIPENMTLGAVVRVMQNLLKEQVSVRDLRTIIETLADESPRTKDLDMLTEAVRKKMARSITTKFMGEDGSVPVFSLSPELEEFVSNSLLQSEQGVQLVMDPSTAQKMITEISHTIEAHPELAAQPVLLTSPTNRRHLRKLTERFIPQLAVLAHQELMPEVNVSSFGTVELKHAG